MFAIAIDMTVADADAHHPRGQRKAYSDVARTLEKFGFRRVQWSVYAAETEDMASLFRAIDALKALPWFGPSVKNIRAFRMEQGSDFTAIVKGS
jgi:CRISPR-associated endonuclease Cas2